jgi:DNA-binding GntR family transcriptional regulator
MKAGMATLRVAVEGAAVAIACPPLSETQQLELLSILLLCRQGCQTSWQSLILV